MPLSKDQSSEIEEARAAAARTRRVTVPALEDLLYRPIPVLDHGFIRVVDYMGADESVVQAARVSYGKGTKKVSTDRGLIRYLMRHWHTTPFEMLEIKFHVKLPIFVARQWIRHRMANVNEYSARYSILDKEFYFPQPDALRVQDPDNRQGTGRNLITKRTRSILDTMKRDAAQAYEHYEEFLGVHREERPENGEPELFSDVKREEALLSRELARITLPVNIYTQWYWKTDLHNLFHFLRLRLDKHAQEEIRAYAQKMSDVVKTWVPNCWEAFWDYRFEAMSLSRVEVRIVRKRLAGEPIDEDVATLSKREREELEAKLGIDLASHPGVS